MEPQHIPATTLVNTLHMHTGIYSAWEKQDHAADNIPLKYMQLRYRA